MEEIFSMTWASVIGVGFSYQTADSIGLFFFQAEDGIRDLTVTGVQTCALPILLALRIDIADGGDLNIGARLQHLHVTEAHAADSDDSDIDAVIGAEHARGRRQREIGRASCRERV